MRHLLLLFTVFLSESLPAQTRTVDLGEIRRRTTRYADITIRNHGEQTVHLVKIEHSPEIVYRVEQDKVKPDSLFRIRVQVNPDTTGRFDHVLRVFLSDDEFPLEIRVIGDVLEMPDYRNLEQKCPEFDQPAKEEKTEFTITTVHAVSGVPISKSTVTLISNGVLTESWVTDSHGTFRRTMAPGFIYFVVSKDGYETTEAGIYLTPEIETIFIPLKKEAGAPEEQREVPDNLVELPVKASGKQLEKILSDQIGTKNECDSSSAAFNDLNFADTSLFKDVNVVFVLDLSSSMKSGEKLNLLKFSLNELVDQLRPTDRLSFVTYSSTASVYLRPTFCDNKEDIHQKIADLKPEGFSSSSQGIKLGYRDLKRNASPYAANMVIVITDGAFNKYSNNYQKTVKKYAAEEITFSVVGIKSASGDAAKMKEAAGFGNGRFVAIDKLSDAQVKLIREIRMFAYRGR